MCEAVVPPWPLPVVKTRVNVCAGAGGGRNCCCYYCKGAILGWEGAGLNVSQAGTVSRLAHPAAQGWMYMVSTQ